MTSRKETAAELRTLGNAAFTAGRFQEADDLYAEALLMLLQQSPQGPKEDFAALHANRAACLLKLGRPAAALEEAETATRKHPAWSKGYFRKAEALKALQRWREAASAMGEAARLAPQEAAVKAQAQQLKARAQQEEDKPALARLEEYVKEKGTIANLPVTPAYSQFQVLDELGEGNYSQVFKATFVPTREVFALKVIDRKKAERLSMRHGNLRYELRAERRILSKLYHPNIVKLFATFQDAKNIYYIEEFCSGRELWFRLKVVPPACLKREWPVESRLWGLCGLRLSECRFFLAQIVNALAYLRRQGVVHRDLKPENVMIAEREGDARVAQVKLIDFGTARDLLDVYDDTVADEDKKEDSDDRNNDDQDQDIDGSDPVYKGAALGKKRKQTHFVGTAEFMSPEAIHGRPADHRSDMWSLGCTAFQLFTGRTPFKGQSDYLTFLKAEAAAYALPTFFDPSGPEKRLVDRLLRVKPEDRVQRAEDLKAEPFFAGIDFDALENPETPPRIPIPTLLELCVERIGMAVWVEAEAWGDGPLTRKSAKTFNPGVLPRRKRFEGDEERQKMQLETLHSRLDDGVKTLVRGWLEQRSCLSCATTTRILYGEAGLKQDRIKDRRFVNHSVLGFSQQEEGYYSEPFLVALINQIGCGGSEQDEADKKAIVDKLNKSDPPPRLFFVASSAGDADVKFLDDVREDIVVAPVPCGGGKGASSYYSMWLGGVLFIVLDAFTLAEDPAQQSWFDRELLVAKLCARYCVVVSAKRFFSKSHASTEEALKEGDDNDAEMLPRATRERFLRDMQESGTQLILRVNSSAATAPATSSKFVITRATANEPHLTQVETPSFPSKIRVVRLLPTDAVSDPYSKGDLTGYFHLEKGEIASDGEGGAAAGESSDDERQGRTRPMHFDSSSDDE